MKARFEVQGQLDMASRPQQGTLTIDRVARLVSVRPKGRRREYTMPLDAVAEMICRRVIAAELLEKKPRRKVRKVKRGLLSL